MYIVVMDDKEIEQIWERFSALCRERKITESQFCNENGILPTNFKNKKWRKAEPSLDQLIKMSTYFGTSLDYIILGKNDNPLQSRVDELQEKLKLINHITSR